MPIKWSEIAVARYVGEVASTGVALWLGAGVAAVSWFMDHVVIQSKYLGAAEWWSHPTLLFYVCVCSLGLAVAQYRLWRSLDKKRLVFEGERPDIGDALREIKRQPLTEPSPGLVVDLEITRQLTGRRRLRMRSSEAVTGGRASIGDQLERWQHETEFIVYMDFDGEAAPPGTRITLRFHGHRQPSLVKADVVDVP